MDLIELNRSLSPEERLVAFYNHSMLLTQLASVGKKQTNPPTIKE